MKKRKKSLKKRKRLKKKGASIIIVVTRKKIKEMMLEAETADEWLEVVHLIPMHMDWVEWSCFACLKFAEASDRESIMDESTDHPQFN